VATGYERRLGMSAPVFATWLVKQFRPDDEAIIGDLIEEYRAGRSVAWYWRQVVIAITIGLAKELRTHPTFGLRALAIGWVVLLLFFGMLGDLTADALANFGWGWTREFGYRSGVWHPFHISAQFISYVGFAISAWVVGRWHGMPLVLAYATSIVVFQAISATVIEWIARPIGGPHTLFYLISPGLPYVWRSGFVLVPLVILSVGLVSSRKVPAVRTTASRQGN
jgi:hypothetical protein